ncbi:hypothetical protein ACFQ4M_00885 [Thauera mechernichensis]|uniref:ATP-binding protein n=1 Tax=Thauera mechernichensis TaxID=82788 RepID=A0ABW3W7Z2_9RHOO|nr:hypothetical protein [Thauera mechernichensis]MDG3064497.1 hypothetical protein [Thauera mechernichensis]
MTIATETSSGDVFNARDLAPDQVASSFLAPPIFEGLLSKVNNILEGPRGSGKTTLLRMLTPEAFSLFRESTPGKDIAFIGVFVPADVRWAKQLTVRTDRLSDPVAKDALLHAVFSVALNLALVETIQSCAVLHARFGDAHPALFFPLDRKAEAQIVEALSYVWSLDVPLKSFNGIRLALRKRQHELSAAAVQLAQGRPLLEVQAEREYISSTWLDNLVTAVESVNDVLSRPDQIWAILLDELEIVPPALLQTIVNALRSTSNKLRFKLALSPTGSDLIPHDQPGSSSHFEDYRPIRLWYERKNDARDFASRLFASSLSKMLGELITDADLTQTLGSSWARSSDEDEQDDVEASAPDTAQFQRLRAGAFQSLYENDESFKQLLDEKRIDPINPADRDGSPEGTLVRKITQLALHRAQELKSYTFAAGARKRGGARNLHAYTGFPNLIDLTEGNPRWVITLAELLVAEHRSTGLEFAAQSVQSNAVRDFVQQMVAKLTVYPTKFSFPGRRWTPYDFVKALGTSISSQLFDGPFKTDPRMSFVIDQAAIDQFGDYIRIAIDLGALVIMRRGGVAPLASPESAQTLVGSRVRLTYRLAPEFRLPLLYLKERSLSSALRAGELLPESDIRGDSSQHVLKESAENKNLPIQGRLL